MLHAHAQHLCSREEYLPSSSWWRRFSGSIYAYYYLHVKSLSGCHACMFVVCTYVHNTHAYIFPCDHVHSPTLPLSLAIGADFCADGLRVALAATPQSFCTSSLSIHASTHPPSRCWCQERSRGLRSQRKGFDSSKARKGKLAAQPPGRTGRRKVRPTRLPTSPSLRTKQTARSLGKHRKTSSWRRAWRDCCHVASLTILDSPLLPASSSWTFAMLGVSREV